MASRRADAPEICVGISVGSFCSVALWNPEESCAETICNEHGSRFTPAYVAYTDRGVLVGQEAVDQMHTNPANTIYDFNRLLGRRHETEAEQVKARWPFKVVHTGDDRTRIEVTVKGEKKLLAPEEILAVLLTKMKQIAEAYLGTTVKRVVLGVPAFADDRRRMALKDAASIAGLQVLRIATEPTVTAVAHNMHQKRIRPGSECRVVVFSMGRNSFDLSAMLIDDDSIFEIAATAGDGYLGGVDMDERLAKYAAAEFKSKHGVDLAVQPGAMHGLLRDCERAKIALSTASETTLVVQHNDLALSLSITRSKFEELIADIVATVRASLEDLLKQARWTAEQVEYVLLAGGSSAVPCLQRVLSERFPQSEMHSPLRLLSSPREVVVHGLAIMGAILMPVGEPMLRDFLTLDVLPMSIGVELANGTLQRVLPRNTTIPCKRTLRFSTERDNQASFVFGVYAGEQPSVRNNILLHTINVEGITPGPAGSSLLDITFDVDANGILNVTAEHLGYRSPLLTVRRSSSVALSAQEVAALVGRATPISETASIARASLQRSVDSVGYALTLRRSVSDWEPSYVVSREQRPFSSLSPAALNALRLSVTDAQEWLAAQQPDTSAEAYAARQHTFEAATAPIMGPYYGSVRPPCVG